MSNISGIDYFNKCISLQNEQLRCTQRDQRSLYIRFGQDNRPSKPDEVKKLHPDIKFVRTPRFDAEAAGSKFKGICYAFVEFGSEADCKNAKNKLATTQFQGSELFVDFVGEKSRKKKARDGKEKSEFNPSRLFISGLANGVTKTNLKEMFPKCSNTYCGGSGIIFVSQMTIFSPPMAPKESAILRLLSALERLTAAACLCCYHPIF